MSSSSLDIGNKLYDFIRVADDKKLHAIYNLLEDEIKNTEEWWKDKAFVAELDQRFLALESGADKGVTVNELEASISKLRKKNMDKQTAYTAVLSARAQKEITSSWNWYEERQRGLGDRFAKAVIESIHKIEQPPERYSTRYKSYKETPVNVFPF